MSINKNTPRAYYREYIYEYIKDSNIQAIKSVLDDISSVNNNVLDFVNNCLAYAVGQNNLEVVKLLVNCYGANKDSNPQMINFSLKQIADSRLKEFFGFDLNGDKIDLETKECCD